jgi:hypothetical protein
MQTSNFLAELMGPLDAVLGIGLHAHRFRPGQGGGIALFDALREQPMASLLQLGRGGHPTMVHDQA